MSAISSSRAPTRFDWERALLSSELPARTRAIALVLATWVGGDVTCWPSRTTIADRAGVTVRTVATHLSVLRKSGWIVSRRGAPGRSNRYTLRIPDDHQHQTPDTDFLQDGKVEAAPEAASSPLPDQGPDHGSPTGRTNWPSDAVELAATIGRELDEETRMRLNSELVTDPGRYNRLIELLHVLAQKRVPSETIIGAVTATTLATADCVSACMHYRLKPLAKTSG